ncbi:helix-turn-helix domain-containing protein [Guptibacillus algicola]|uniref:helix-turn-helix domain-containing protein n=1 Tax=Guptibacillus algicola TaxID=225844 RepID=UPI001CD3063A|nr:helix-turn-helix domain-containing protein [Alkalihalobacillus algicola]MCA0986763.1 helix-turn-helix domain-containing protein [Alkalihalobacillus algicola]
MTLEDELTATLKALTHPTRREILDLLKDGPKTTGYLDEQFGEISRYAVMKHLSQLEEANLILVRREGRSRMNYLNAVPIQEMYDRWMNKYQSMHASSLLSLKSTLERGTNIMENHGYKHDTFQIEQEIRIQAPIEKVFKSLTEKIDSWWAYRLCGEDSTLSFEPEVGGRFIERGASGEAGALWGTITYINAPCEIRLNGLLGMQGAVNSAYSYKLREEGGETILSLSHHASGLLDPEWHAAHDGGWKELLGTFLKNYVEEGKTYSEQQK